ncbi:MAG: F0F1 ATP synthase subunit A, partial [Bauldia sp.]
MELPDPIHQFEIKEIVPLHLGATNVSFTNSALFMVLAVLIGCGFLLLASSRRRLVPGRWQSSAELLYEFVANTLRSSAGTQGMKFFPLVFSLFLFILMVNLFGMVPYFFTVTSHLIVTAALSLLVIGLVVVYGFYKNGLGFFRLFVP